MTLMMDVKNRFIGIHTVNIGTLNSAIISALEVFKPAILANVASIVVAHNHSSGDVTPSPEDIPVANSLHRAGKLLDMKVLDRVIVGKTDGYT